jgi:dCMP deaminase
VAQAVASHSKCLSRKIGAILVNDKSIISTGYNGPPRGVSRCDKRWLVDPAIRKIGKERIPKFPDYISQDSDYFKKYLEGKCPRRVLGYKSGEGLSICVAGHAERNALINAARNGICTKGLTMYMTCGIPCQECMIEIINAGIDEVVVTTFDFYDLGSQYLLKESGMKARLFDFLEKEDI